MYNDLLQETTALQERRKLEGIFSILDPTSKEYQTIADRFQRTMSHRIFRIEQIHNKDLLNQYSVAKAGVGSGAGSEDMYFHGSNNNNYVNIATKGFDITRSKNGLLGVGVYFAVNASYSNQYTDSLELPGSNVVKNMLMCRVYKVPSDQTGTDIICIKDDRRAYPMYIIYYRNVNEF